MELELSLVVQLELAAGEGGIGSAVVALGHLVGEAGTPVVVPGADPGLPAAEPLPDILPQVFGLRVVGAVLSLPSF